MDDSQPPAAKMARMGVLTGSFDKMEELLRHNEGLEWTRGDSIKQCARSLVQLGDNCLNITRVAWIIKDHTRRVPLQNIHQVLSTLISAFQEWKTATVSMRISEHDSGPSGQSRSPSPSDVLPHEIDGIISRMKSTFHDKLTRTYKPYLRELQGTETMTGTTVTFLYLGLDTVSTAKLSVIWKLPDLIDLEELSMYSAMEVPMALLKSIIADEKCQDDFKKEGLLKPRLGASPPYGKFSHVHVGGNHPLMLYESAYQCTSKAMKLSAYASNINVSYTKQDGQQLQSCTESCHPFLYPYFMANAEVTQLLQQWVNDNASSPLISSVKEVLKMYDHKEGNIEGYKYNEEDWTDRLVKTLNIHPFFQSGACVKSFRFGHNSIMDTFRIDTFGIERRVAKMYLFHGLPDMYFLNHCTPLLGLTADHRDDEYETVPEESGRDSVASPAEQFDTAADPSKVVIGEMSKHLVPLNAPLDKMGELMANMHCAHNDHILHQFLENNNHELQQFTIDGLFVNRESGLSRLSMELKPKEINERPLASQLPSHFTCYQYHINHIIFPTRVLEPPLLCAALKEYAGINLHSVAII